MTAKEYLLQVQALETKIKQQMEALEMLKSAAVSTTSYISFTKVQNGSTSDRVGNMAGKIVDMENEISENMVLGLYKKHEIMNQIHSLKNALHIEVLFKRYIELKNFDEIATETNYTYRYIIELHGKALKAFEKMHKDILQKGTVKSNE